MKRRSNLLTILSLALVASAWNANHAGDWARSLPAEQGLDGKVLSDLDAYVESTLPHLRSLLIARHEHLVYERHFHGALGEELENIQSITKSVTGALIGIALKKGQISSLDLRVTDYFPDVLDSIQNTRARSITVKHLLTMSSGIVADPPQWDRRDENPLKSALTRPLVCEPGVRFIYSGYASHILAAILSKVAHESVYDFADINLFRPLGISKVVWYTDKNGLHLGCGSSLWRACDILKLGQLYLNKGRWNGVELIPQSYVAQSTQTQLEGDFFGTHIRYGYLWFTDTISGHEVFLARGYGGQYLLVAPGLDLVVLCTSDWHQPEYPEHYAIMKNFVIPSVVNSRKQP